jgi:Protein of unknown function (DUF2490)
VAARAFTLALLIAALPAAARADDTQLWTTALAVGPITPGAGVQPMVHLEYQPRFANDVSRMTQMIVRAGFGVRIAPDFTILAGYHYQRNDPAPGARSDEHRMWQQLLFPLHRDPEHLLLLTRLRLEQRSIAGAQDLGWRGRAMLRLQLPMKGRGSAGPLLWSEALIPLNDTDWGQRRNTVQSRNFIGALVPINPRINLEAGYMAQIDHRPGSDRINHVGNLLLSYRLGN